MKLSTSFFVLIFIALLSSSVFSFELSVRKIDYYTNNWSYLSGVIECSASLSGVNTTDLEISSLYELDNYNSANEKKIEAPSDFDALIISDGSMQMLPKGIDVFFPGLRGLRITSVNLQFIEQSNFEPLKFLVELDLSNNDLIFLESDLFKHNTELKKINFNSNALRYVAEDLLTPLVNLEKAYFQDCYCISDYKNSNSAVGLLRDRFKEKCRHQVTAIFKSRINNVETLRSDESIAAAQKYHACDGNLDAATKGFFKTSKVLEICRPSDKEKTEKRLSEILNITCNGDDKSICVVDYLKTTRPEAIISGVKGDFFESFNYRDVTTKIRIFQQQTLFLPTNLGELFPELEALEVIDSGLFSLNSKCFKEMGGLNHLNLSSNKLIEIPEETFQSLGFLTLLDLSLNKIETLEPGVFKNLKMLKVLKLNGNKLVNMKVEILEGLESLKELFMQNNRLKFISANLLTHLTQLKLADLTRNLCIDMSYPTSTLEELDASIINNCIAPIDLNCKGSSILTSYGINSEESVCDSKLLTVDYPKTKIKIVLASNDKSLTVFAAVNQSMKFMPYQLGSSLPNVTKIIVESSKLTTLQKHDFEGFTQLKTIIIRHNNLTKIEEQAFDDAKQVESMDLASNNIQSLPPKVFLHLIRLKSLILSNNLIESFTADMLPRKNAIEEFWVDNNQLEIIETKTLRFLRKAKIIDFTGNSCIDRKFEQTQQDLKSLLELSGEIDLNCSADDV